MSGAGRILVTGGCGFIGANLVPALAAAGHAPVVFDNFAHAAVDGFDDPAVRLVRGDVRQEDALAEAAADCDAVIHLAASGSVVDSVVSPKYNFDVNARGTFNVLHAARQAGIGRVVFASTGGALMGDTPPPVDETSVPRPIAPYGASKLAGEGYCSAFAAAYGMQTVVLRFANVYGPHSWHKQGVISNFLNAVLERSPFVIYGDGAASRDFLHVRDLCAGILAALETPVTGHAVMHLASGTETTLDSLVAIVRAVADRPHHPVERRARRPGEVGRNFADASLARRLLGFAPRVPLRTGLAETLAWFAARHAGA